MEAAKSDTPHRVSRRFSVIRDILDAGDYYCCLFGGGMLIPWLLFLCATLEIWKVHMLLLQQTVHINCAVQTKAYCMCNIHLQSLKHTASIQLTVVKIELYIVCILAFLVCGNGVRDNIPNRKNWL